MHPANLETPQFVYSSHDVLIIPITSEDSPPQGEQRIERKSSMTKLAEKVSQIFPLKWYQPPFRPWFNAAMVAVMIIVFIAELSLNYSNTGSLIDTGTSSGVFNYMIGPSPLTMIQSGAKYTPCMRPTGMINRTISLSPTGKPSYSLEEFCGLGGFSSGTPDQLFRFFTPIFLHGGLLHLVINVLVQYQSGWPLEAEYGYAIIGVSFMSSGISGVLLSAVYGPAQQVSLGASGAVFGLIALETVDILKKWTLINNPRKEFCILVLLIAVTIGLSFLPGIDYLAHIGGYSMGLLCAFVFLPIKSNAHKKHMWWAARVVGIVGIVSYFVVFFRYFFVMEVQIIDN